MILANPGNNLNVHLPHALHIKIPQLSGPKMMEWLGRYAQIRGIGPICPGRGGVAWGRPYLFIYISL